MATLREIRRRITGIKNTQKITKAMKMVAAAKLRRAQEAIFAARPYARKLNDVLLQLIDQTDTTSHPLFAKRDVQRVLVIVLAGERGLCGAFNSNVLRSASEHIQQYNIVANVSVIAIGKKASDYFTKRMYHVVGTYAGIFDKLQFHNAQLIIEDVVERYLKGEIDKVEVVYNEFKSVIQQRVVVEQLLPYQVTQQAEEHSSKQNRIQNYIYEPFRRDILSILIPRQLNYQMWRMLLESATAEQAARMTAMNNATDNASELLSELTLTYNKARQAGITKELLEIVSGAEALKKAG